MFNVNDPVPLYEPSCDKHFHRSSAIFWRRGAMYRESKLTADPRISQPPIRATSQVVLGTNLHLRQATIASKFLEEQALPLVKLRGAPGDLMLHASGKKQLIHKHFFKKFSECNQ